MFIRRLLRWWYPETNNRAISVDPAYDRLDRICKRILSTEGKSPPSVVERVHAKHWLGVRMWDEQLKLLIEARMTPDGRVFRVRMSELRGS